MSIYKNKNLIKIFGLVIIIFISFFVSSHKAQAVSVIQTGGSVSPTLITFDGQVKYSTGEQPYVLYYYFFKYSETNITTIDATRVKLSQTPPLYKFTLLLGNSTKPLTPKTKYILVVTQKPTMGGDVANFYFNKWIFDTPSAGSGNTITETAPPQVTTLPAKSDSTSVLMVGSIQNDNKPTTVWFKTGLTTTTLNKITAKQTMSKDGEFTLPFSSIYKNPDAPTDSIYYYQACGKNTKGESCSNKTESFGSNMVNQNIPLPANGTPASVDTDTTYTPLAPLPGLEKFDTDPLKNPCPFGKYFNILLKIFIGIAAVLSMIMIVVGGIEYMTSDLVSSKESGRSKITNAILGLILALGSYAILNTLNPKLLEVCLDNLPKATITISPETDEQTLGIEGKTTTIAGQTITACKEEEITKFGSDGKTPLSLFGKPIPGGMNKALVKDVEAINTAWENSTSAAIKNYKITTVGAGYVCRSVKGSPTKTSAHAFGLAIDINPGKNPFEPGATVCKTDMPPEFVKLFTDRGWGWGGNWNSVKDAMHFSKLSTEIGHNSACGNVSAREEFSSATFNINKKQIDLTVLNYDKVKNHKASIYNGEFTKTVDNLNKFGTNSGTIVSGTTGYIFIKLTDAEYQKLKGFVEVALWSAGSGLGTNLLNIK